LLNDFTGVLGYNGAKLHFKQVQGHQIDLRESGSPMPAGGVAKQHSIDRVALGLLKINRG
jgi:hypothetical protein